MDTLMAIPITELGRKGKGEELFVTNNPVSQVKMLNYAPEDLTLLIGVGFYG